MNTEAKKSSWLARNAPILLLLVIAAPMVSAWIMFKYFPDSVRSLGTSNYGEFVIPPVKVSLDGLMNIDGAPVDASRFDKKWVYVYIHTDTCDMACRAHLMLIKNLRLTQGKEIGRLKRIFITSQSSVDSELKQMLEEFPGMTTIVLKQDKPSQELLQTFNTQKWPQPGNQHYIYVVDPDTKWMMTYPPHKDLLKEGKGMQKDMSKLMKNSQLRK